MISLSGCAGADGISINIPAKSAPAAKKMSFLFNLRDTDKAKIVLNKETRSTLLEWLGSNDVDLRYETVITVGELGPLARWSLPSLQELANDLRSPDAARHFRQSFSDGPSSVLPFSQLFDPDQQVTVLRNQVLIAMFQIDPRAPVVTGCLKSFSNHDDVSTREIVAKRLGKPDGK